MAASQIRRILIFLLLVTGAFGQPRSISIAVFPAESTLHVGQIQSFTAVVVGTSEAVIEWMVLEPAGGTITQEGIYTAPYEVGIYHVLATATSSSDGARAQITAKVTVLIDYDVPPLRSGLAGANWLVTPAHIALLTRHSGSLR